MQIPESVKQKIEAIKTRNRKARRAFVATLKRKRRKLARANQRLAKRAVMLKELTQLSEEFGGYKEL